jgi:natural product biosynthesis luciferase-like monooxygenase protein
MDLSLFYFADSGAYGDTYRLLLEGARLADECGLAAVWMPERHFHPFGGPYPNPAVTGAALATTTRRIAIRAGSVVGPLHHPVRIAEEWAAVDNLSGGRAGVSLASGWNAMDFALRPENFAERRRVTAETVTTLRRLWSGQTVTLPDGEGNPVEVASYPRPVQPRLPMWLTSAGSVETFRLAGELGTGVLTHLLGQEIEDLAAKIGAYHRALAGRPDHDGWPGHVALMVHTYLGDDTEEARRIARGPFSAYLKSSFSLFARQFPGAEEFDPAELSEEDIDFLIERSADRFLATSGLFGTPAEVAVLADRLAGTGVDELACLIDFGVDADLVLAGVPRIAELGARLADPVAKSPGAGPVPAVTRPNIRRRDAVAMTMRRFRDDHATDGH